MELSLIVPIMNEEENIKPLFEAIQNSLKEFDYEVIIVDDGSTDNSVNMAKKFATDRFKIVVFQRNYGQTTAMAAGISLAKGELIATIDGDLQNDPSDIPMMINILKEKSVDVVAGRRVKRRDGFFLRKIPSKIANWLIRKTTGVELHDYGCTLKVFKKTDCKRF